MLYFRERRFTHEWRGVAFWFLMRVQISSNVKLRAQAAITHSYTPRDSGMDEKHLRRGPDETKMDVCLLSTRGVRRINERGQAQYTSGKLRTLFVERAGVT